MSIICITGASSGIGLCTAKRFAANGWQVIAAARRLDRLKELAKEYPAQILPKALDVCDTKAIQEFFASLPEDYARIDVLLNNAGLALGLNPAQECDPNDWEIMVDTNIKGLMHLSREVLPGMIERGRGHIINIGSIAGTYAYPGGNVYGATKAFVKQFSRNLRCDLHGTGVRVSNIEPGLLETEFSLVRFKGDEKTARALYAGANALKPEDIAEIIWWVEAMPAHVNINSIEVMPTSQSNAPLRVWKA